MTMSEEGWRVGRMRLGRARTQEPFREFEDRRLAPRGQVRAGGLRGRIS